MELNDIYKHLEEFAKNVVLDEPVVEDASSDESAVEDVNPDVGSNQDSQEVSDSDIALDEEAGCMFISPVKWLHISKELESNSDLSFDFLMCITSYDVGSGKLGLAYNLYSNKVKHSIEIRMEFEDSVEIPSVTSVWKTADWHEREAYDMMGVKFSGHPDMKRILLSEDWEGYPLRKDYKEPDYYRGVPVPKDKTAWE